MPYKLTEDQEAFLKDLVYKEGNFFGLQKLYTLIRTQHPDQKLSRREVWSWMARQEVLQINRRPTMNRGIVTPMVSSKAGWIQLDNIDMTSHAYNGYKYIVHATDLFLKKDWAKAVKALTVENIKEALEEFIDQGMKCSYLQTDQGSEFKGDFTEFCQDLDIVHRMSKSHSPWANGTVESRNSGIQRLIFMYMRTSGNSDWPNMLQKFIQNINSTFNHATKKSANELEQADEAVQSETATRLQNTASKKYGKKSQKNPLNVGDWVRIRLFDKSGIVKRSCVGYWSKEIYEIVSIYTPRKLANLTQSYKIKNKDTGEVQHGLYSLGQLMVIPKNTELLPEPVVNPPAVNEGQVENDEELERLVDTVVSHKVIRGTRNRRPQVLYQVKFTVYRKLFWQTEEDLQGARRILNEYKNAHRIP